MRALRILTVVLLLFGLPAPAVFAQTEGATSCVRCHGAMTGRLGDPVQQWEGSIHAVNGIGCNSCHGGDPTLDSMEAMSPQRGFLGVPREAEIPEFCGKCHAGVLEDYRESAHGQALGTGGPTCATCHGNHAVEKATPELINRETCTQCHGYERADEIKSALAGTDEMISNLNQDISRLHRIGIDTEELDNSLFAVRNDFHRLFHSVDVQKVKNQTAGFQQELKGIRDQLEGISAELERRKIGGGIVVALLLLATILSGLLRRTYKREEEREKPTGGAL